MQDDLPRLAAWRGSRPGVVRFRWRVFARLLAVFAGFTTLTALALLVALRVLSPAAAGAVGLTVALGGSAVAALLLSRWLERRVAGLMRAVDSGSADNSHDSSEDDADDPFAGVIPSWQSVLRTLREGRQEKHNEARQHYETLTELMRMFAKAVDERTAFLRGHSERVAVYAAAIARKMCLFEEQVERIRLSALLHDIGSLGVEDFLVMKETPLTPEEFEILKVHTVKGAAILRPIAMLQDLIPGIELHHESLDGQGYPYGLKGKEIPLMARIVAVADGFDAMTTPRPYREAMNPDYVLEVMGRLAGTRYDPAVVTALSELVRSGVLQVKNVRVPVSFRMRKPMAV